MSGHGGTAFRTYDLTSPSYLETLPLGTTGLLGYSRVFKQTAHYPTIE